MLSDPLADRWTEQIAGGIPSAPTGKLKRRPRENGRHQVDPLELAVGVRVQLDLQCDCQCFECLADALGFGDGIVGKHRRGKQQPAN